MEKELKEKIRELRDEILTKKDTEKNMIIGIDGFVDEIVHVVDKRQDFNNFTRIKTIEEFGNKICNAAGLSANFEMVTTQTKLGGNGPILANALIEYGTNLTYIGAIGDTDISPVFKQMADNSKKVYTLCDPGHTDALEFEDGKLMMGKITVLNKITWERFKEVVGTPLEIAKMIEETDLFGMENWTMVPHMSQILKGIIEEVFPLLKDKAEKPLAFFDLADPEKRTNDDVIEAMKLIGKFEAKFRTILGLNEKELFEIADIFGVLYDKTTDKKTMLQTTTEQVYNKLGIDTLVIHPTKEALVVSGGKYYYTEGPYCEKPVLTTGAGDNFNAGFCLGSVLKLTPYQSLLVGVATSGFYVRNGKSPKFEDLLEFLDKWCNEEL